MAQLRNNVGRRPGTLKRVHFPTNLGVEFRINSERGRFSPELRKYIKERTEELAGEEADRKREMRAKKRLEAESVEDILQSYREGVCWGRETPCEFPVFTGSLRWGAGGGGGKSDIGAGCFLGKDSAAVVVDDAALEKGEEGADDHLSPLSSRVVSLEEGRLLDRSFDLWATEVHRSLRRSRRWGRVLGTGLLCTGIVITSIVVAVYFTVTPSNHQ